MLRRSPRGFVLPFALAVLASVALPAMAASTAAPQPAASADLHAWERGDDPAALDSWVHEHLRRADAQVARLLAVKGARTVENTLRPYDEAFNELMLATAQ